MKQPNRSLRRFRCPQCGGEVRLPPDSTSIATCATCRLTFSAGEGIVSLTPPAEDRDYPQELVELVAAVEERHFWFSSRNEVILETMRDLIGPLAGKRALDVGCGTGYVLAALEGAGLEACGIDMHRAALARARRRVRGALFCSNAASLPFFPDFDVVTLFDVIEHADDDVGLLRQARGVLAPDGHIVVTVPAGPDLWTQYDEVSGHKRRYERAGLAAALARAGFQVRSVSYFNCLPLLAQILQRRISSGAKADPGDAVGIVRRALRIPPEPLNTLFRMSVRAEAPFRRLRWLRGGSLIAVAQNSGA